MKPLVEAEVTAVLERAEGNVSKAAAQIGVRRDQLWDFVLKWPLLMVLLENLREAMVDEAEAQLRVALAVGRPWAIAFVLKTIGRDRGYGDAFVSSDTGERTSDTQRLTARQLTQFAPLPAIPNGT